jgi:hypothetical protein
MMPKILLSVFLLTSSMFAANSLQAEVAKKDSTPVFQAAGNQFAGLSLGMAKPSGTYGTPLRFTYGVDYSYALATELSVGAFASRDNGKLTSRSNVDFAITMVGAQVTYSPVYDAYLNLRAGMTLLDFSSSNGNTISSSVEDSHPFFLSPGFGVIFPVCDKVQFIPNIHYTYFFSTSDTDNFNKFDATASFRYQF